MDIAETVAAFEALTLPFDVWRHHETHLRVSMWYVMTYPAAEATTRIREGIQRFNAANDRPQTPEGGYHETITLAFIHLIRHFLAISDHSQPFEILAADLMVQYGGTTTLLSFYSKERLLSWEARTTWTEPDVKPLPML